MLKDFIMAHSLIRWTMFETILRYNLKTIRNVGEYLSLFSSFSLNK